MLQLGVHVPCSKTLNDFHVLVTMMHNEMKETHVLETQENIEVNTNNRPSKHEAHLLTHPNQSGLGLKCNINEGENKANEIDGAISV